MMTMLVDTHAVQSVSLCVKTEMTKSTIRLSKNVSNESDPVEHSSSVISRSVQYGSYRLFDSFTY